MRLGLLSDAHANAAGTQAVLDFFRESKLEAILFGGDAVGYSAEPHETIQLLRNSGALGVLGNHDSLVLSGGKNDYSSELRRSLQHAQSALSREDREWLGRLPLRLDLTFGNCRSLLLHGSPGDLLNGRLQPQEVTERLFPDGVNTLIVGHTHLAFHVTSTQGIVINPGSCGLPRDGDPRASCSIFDTDTNQVSSHRLLYDCCPLVERNVSLGLGTEVNDRLMGGAAFKYPVSISERYNPVLLDTAQRLEDEGLRVMPTPGGFWAEFRNRGQSGLLTVVVLTDGSQSVLARTTPISRPWEPWDVQQRLATCAEMEMPELAVRQNNTGRYLETRSLGPLLKVAPVELAASCLQLRAAWIRTKKTCEE